MFSHIKYRTFGVREIGIEVHGMTSPRDTYMNALKEKSILKMDVLTQ